VAKIKEKNKIIRAEIEFGRVVLEFGKGLSGLGIRRKEGGSKFKNRASKCCDIYYRNHE
jgi:hypothetical protein